MLKARLHAKGLDSIDVVTPDHLLKMKEEEEAHLIVFFDMNLLSEDSPYPLVHPLFFNICVIINHFIISLERQMW